MCKHSTVRTHVFEAVISLVYFCKYFVQNKFSKSLFPEIAHIYLMKEYIYVFSKAVKKTGHMICGLPVLSSL